jgi:hypothetical protein
MQKFVFALSALSFALVIPLISVNIKASVQNASLNQHQVVTQRGSQLPASSRLGAYPLLGRPSSTVYDEQLGATFTQDSTVLAYTVIAVAQKGTDNYGPAYLLNGLGNTGYWYQVGLSYNWDPSSATGFQLAYSVFNPSGNLVLPTSNGAGLAAISPVNPGDSVLLSLSFVNGNVIMQGTDQNTGAQAQEKYTASGSTVFSGSASAPSNAQGFFSGLMTEWYHSAPYTGSEKGVIYTTNGSPITSAWLWMDEFSVSQRGIGSSVFNNFTKTPAVFTDPLQLQTLSSNGAIVSANATQFITGQVPSAVQLTFSYSVTGGAGTSTAPVLTYTAGGATKTASLSQTSQIISVDGGTSWSINDLLSSSTSTERWLTSQTTTGTAIAALTTDFIFTHQYYVTANPDPVTGGSISILSGWFDAGTQFQTAASPKSGWQFERWSGSGNGSYTGNSISTQIVVNAPLTETATFYPGLTITASGNVSVAYSNAAATGSVHPGISKVIYFPAGTDIQLIAKTKLFIYSFSGWTGLTTSGKSKISIMLDAPQNIITSSSYNYINIGIAIIVVIVIIVLVIVAVARKKKKPSVDAYDSESGTKD